MHLDNTYFDMNLHSTSRDISTALMTALTPFGVRTRPYYDNNRLDY